MCNTKVSYKNAIATLISLIDDKLQRQVNAILHHPDLQALESRWRGLFLLTQQAVTGSQIKIRCLDVNYREFVGDIVNATEFDQSELFKKIYTKEFDQPGGEPYGLLIGDYYFSHRQVVAGIDSVSALREMAKIAAASFCPFISGASPHLLGLDHFSELQAPMKINAVFKLDEYQRWLRLRQMDDMRFIGLCLPRLCIRAPYNQFGRKHGQLFFEETIACIDDYCWANACFRYAELVMATFKRYAWFGELCGLTTAQLVNESASSFVRLDYHPRQLIGQKKPVTELVLSDREERLLSEQGLIALKDQPLTQHSVYYHSPSLQQSRNYSNEYSNANAKLSSQLNYMLCVSRFAHYVKIIMRNKLGSFLTAEDCQTYLQRWILRYCTANDNLDLTTKAERPLRQAKITVLEQAGRADAYSCVMKIMPHYQLEQVETSLRLMTELNLAA